MGAWGMPFQRNISSGELCVCVCVSCRRNKVASGACCLNHSKQTLPKGDGESGGVDMLKTREEQKPDVRATKDFGSEGRKAKFKACVCRSVDEVR